MQALDPLLYQYDETSTPRPVVQLTEQAIANLLGEQHGWAAANAVQIAGSIESKVVTSAERRRPPTELP